MEESLERRRVRVEPFVPAFLSSALYLLAWNNPAIKNETPHYLENVVKDHSSHVVEFNIENIYWPSLSIRGKIAVSPDSGDESSSRIENHVSIWANVPDGLGYLKSILENFICDQIFNSFQNMEASIQRWTKLQNGNKTF